ncbi:MAG TPA: histone deacetylase [Candidatus Binatia bacterium]|jgi:acetoin utilization deacetylase AcuC-like enzyme
MARSGVVIDPEYLKHEPGEFHPERPERIRALLSLAETLDKDRFQILPPRPATRSEVGACHGADYVRMVEATSKTNHFALDGDTITCRDSFAVGLLAVGGFLRLIDSIAAGESSNGFALVRPPGHHALKNRAMGFCLFNTIAIGAQHLKKNYGADRIMVVDWDVHHGNGTQDSFYEDPGVLFISTHQFPYYPGTGAVSEVGRNAGEGYTINIPLPAGCGDAEYLRVFHEVVVPAAEKFAPQWILVSAGFDPHRRDPLGGMEVSEVGFAGMARLLLRLADRYAESRIAFLLEGGYDLAALNHSVSAVLEVMQKSSRAVEDPKPDGLEIDPLIRKILQVHEKYR